MSLTDGTVFAYEALSRITLPTSTLTIDQLFHIAVHKQKLWELEKLCRSKALENAVSMPSGIKLFLNVDANIIHDPELKRGFTAGKLSEYGIDSKDVIIEITENNTIEAVR